MTDDNKHLHCNFCGKKREDVEKLIAGPNVYICDECIKLSYDIVKNKELDDDDDFFESIPSPQEIKQFLDEFVVGQDNAKEVLSVSAYNHYKKISALNHDVEFDKSNIILIGPTGSGKTLLAKTLAKKLHIPFAITDATTLTEAGYVGEDVESVLERLLSVANYDLALAQKGIIFIDEIDKKSRKSESNTTRDVSGEGVQQALLRLVEGTETKVKVSGSKSRYSEEYVTFNTKNVLFILSGAFVGIEQNISKRLKKKSHIGFSATILDKSDQEKLLSFINGQDIIDYGIIPELVGRLPTVATLNKLSKKQIKELLTNVKNNVIIQTKELFLMDNLNIELGNDFIDQCASLSLSDTLGARSVRSVVEDAVFNHIFRTKELINDGVIGIRYDKYPTEADLPVLVYKDKEVVDTEYKFYKRGF